MDESESTRSRAIDRMKGLTERCKDLRGLENVRDSVVAAQKACERGQLLETVVNLLVTIDLLFSRLEVLRRPGPYAIPGSSG